MTECFFRHTSSLPVVADEAYAWHGRKGALERLLPPWRKVRIVRAAAGVEEGKEVFLEVGVGPLSLRWHLQHGPYQVGSFFSDRQVEGPFALWEHYHRFYPGNGESSTLEDNIHYAVRGGTFGPWLVGRWFSDELERLFRYRHAVTTNDLALHRRYSATKKLKVAIAGASGLVGEALVPFLSAGGHEVKRFVRRREEGDSSIIFWNPYAGELDPEALDGVDVVINLAGENIAARRWTRAQKEKILKSRVLATKTLSEAVARMKNPPQVFINASACGYFGSAGSDVLTEASPKGEDFLATVCSQWEAAIFPVATKGVRVAFLRFGVILSSKGGALAKMVIPFKMGVGGIVGTGEQYLSWITLDDALGVILHAMATPSLQGPINVVTPHPVTNHDFTKALGAALHRPTFLPLPAIAARLALGEMADALLLSSCRALPQALKESGYNFLYPVLPEALNHVLGTKTEG